MGTFGRRTRACRGQLSGLGQYIQKIIISICAQKPHVASGSRVGQYSLRG